MTIYVGCTTLVLSFLEPEMAFTTRRDMERGDVTGFHVILPSRGDSEDGRRVGEGN